MFSASVIWIVEGMNMGIGEYDLELVRARKAEARQALIDSLSDVNKAKLALALLESISPREEYRAFYAERKDAIKSVENMIAIAQE